MRKLLLSLTSLYFGASITAGLITPKNSDCDNFIKAVTQPKDGTITKYDYIIKDHTENIRAEIDTPIRKLDTLHTIKTLRTKTLHGLKI